MHLGQSVLTFELNEKLGYIDENDNYWTLISAIIKCHNITKSIKIVGNFIWNFNSLMWMSKTVFLISLFLFSKVTVMRIFNCRNERYKWKRLKVNQERCLLLFKPFTLIICLAVYNLDCNFNPFHWEHWKMQQLLEYFKNLKSLNLNPYNISNFISSVEKSFSQFNEAARKIAISALFFILWLTLFSCSTRLLLWLFNSHVAMYEHIVRFSIAEKCILEYSINCENIRIIHTTATLPAYSNLIDKYF